MTVGAIVLGAGSARRMGADKLMADLGGQPVIAHILASIERAGLPAPILALPPGSAIAEIAERAQLVEIVGHAGGMGCSLAEAIGAVPADWDAVLICLGDMPFVAPQTLALLVASASADAIVRPSFDGKPGNPVAWGRRFFTELAALVGDQGGRILLDRHADRLVGLSCADAGILQDIDTPSDLAAARVAIAS